MAPNTAKFELVLSELLSEAKQREWVFIDVSSGNLHQLVGGYPSPKGENHAMPTCCRVMRKMKKPNDEILNQSKSEDGAKLVIRYRIAK